jgi:tetratricopeptide (TPR) repeat protein
VLLLLLIHQPVKIDRRQVSIAIGTLAAGSFIIAIIQYGMEVISHGWYLAAADKMTGSFAHKNIFAEVMLLTLPFSVYWGFTSGKASRLGGVVVLATCVLILLLLSRAVWLGLGVGIVITAMTYLLAQHKWKPRWYHLGYGLVAVLALVLVYEWFIWRTSVGDYLAYFYSHRNTVNERKHLWSATWQIIKSHPVIGAGLGSWKVANMEYYIVGLRDYMTFFQQPHNDYLWIWSEQGILALLAVAAAWIWVVYRLYRQIVASPSDWFLYTLLFALTGYAVYAGLAFPRERVEHMLIISMATFFVLGADGTQRIAVPRGVVWVALILIAMGGWWAGQRMQSEIHLRQFFEARAINDVAAQRSLLDAISPTYFSLDGTATPIAWYSGLLYYTQSDLTQASIDFDRAIGANPYHAYSLNNVGTCLSLKGDRQGAQHYFELALKYAPGFPDAALNLCALKYQDGQIDSAAYFLSVTKDTLADPRYVKSLQVITQALLPALLDSVHGDSMSERIVMDLSKKTAWQAEVYRKAYFCKRNIRKQIVMDVAWIRENSHANSEKN